MNQLLRPLALLLALSLLGSALEKPSYAADPPKKIAFLVGVSKYDKAGLRNLNYAEDDIQDLSRELKPLGFNVQVLLGSESGEKRATAENLRQKLLDQFVTQTKSLKRDDVVLVVFSGHGLQREVTRNDKRVEDSFFCPVDCVVNDDKETYFFSISELMDRLGNVSGSENNLFIVDACRNNPGKGVEGGVKKGVDGSGVKLPDKISCLFGASYGTQSFESDEFKHGLLSHFLLEGLRGKAVDNDGEVTWDSWTSYAKKQVLNRSLEIVKSEQRPNIVANHKGFPIFVSKSILASGNKKPEFLVAPFDSQTARRKQDEWATYLRLRERETTNTIGMKFTVIPAGEFMMGGEKVADLKRTFSYLDNYLNNDKDGSLKSELAGELPAHRVRITKPFLMGTHHVTKANFNEFVRDTGYKTDSERSANGGRGFDPTNQSLPYDPKYSWRYTGFEYRDDHPVVNVTWNDATEFCKWLSRKEGKTYRLPTEAEFEYACRAGTTTRYYNGDDPDRLAEIGNVTDKSGKAEMSWLNAINADDGYAFTAPVGLSRYKPNNFGLSEMLGNVPTWVNDYFSESYYSNSPLEDPKGPTTGKLRLYRGGGWLCVSFQCRSAFRHTEDPNSCCCCMGLRIACEAP